jgi:formylglycine-generating enzyme required for sulfatase activity
VAAWSTGYRPADGSGKHAHLNGGLGLVDVGSDAGTAFETGWVGALDDRELAPTDANLACTSPTALWTWSAVVGPQENLPINCVTWEEAYAFCIWDGGFLPSSAEWQYAAAGGAEQRIYPWGKTDPGTASQYAIYDCDYASPAGQTCSTTAIFAPVGTPALGAGRWGQLDLSGNVFEWMLDREAPFVEPCDDCASLTPAGQPRVIRGSDANSSAVFMTVPYPFNVGFGLPVRGAGIGFRCAR